MYYNCNNNNYYYDEDHIQLMYGYHSETNNAKRDWSNREDCDNYLNCYMDISVCAGNSEVDNSYYLDSIGDYDVYWCYYRVIYADNNADSGTHDTINVVYWYNWYDGQMNCHYLWHEGDRNRSHSCGNSREKDNNCSYIDIYYEMTPNSCCKNKNNGTDNAYWIWETTYYYDLRDRICWNSPLTCGMHYMGKLHMNDSSRRRQKTHLKVPTHTWRDDNNSDDYDLHVEGDNRSSCMSKIHEDNNYYGCISNWESGRLDDKKGRYKADKAKSNNAKQQDIGVWNMSESCKPYKNDTKSDLFGKVGRKTAHLRESREKIKQQEVHFSTGLKQINDQKRTNNNYKKGRAWSNAQSIQRQNICRIDKDAVDNYCNTN